jgi:hypothetical protein
VVVVVVRAEDEHLVVSVGMVRLDVLVMVVMQVTEDPPEEGVVEEVTPDFISRILKECMK